MKKKLLIWWLALLWSLQPNFTPAQNSQIQKTKKDVSTLLIQNPADTISYHKEIITMNIKDIFEKYGKEQAEVIVKKHLLKEINNYRSSLNIPLVQPDTALWEAAQRLVEYLHQHDTIAHSLHGKWSHAMWVDLSYFSSFSENIALNNTIEWAMNARENSKYHNKNMIDPTNTSVWIGVIWEKFVCMYGRFSEERLFFAHKIPVFSANVSALYDYDALFVDGFVVLIEAYNIIKGATNAMIRKRAEQILQEKGKNFETFEKDLDVYIQKKIDAYNATHKKNIEILQNMSPWQKGSIENFFDLNKTNIEQLHDICKYIQWYEKFWEAAKTQQNDLEISSEYQWLITQFCGISLDDLKHDVQEKKHWVQKIAPSIVKKTKNEKKRWVIRSKIKKFITQIRVEEYIIETYQQYVM